MKKIILLLAIGFFAITANAQKAMETTVSPQMKTAFAKLFPGATVTSWTKEPVNNVRAAFVNAGVPTTVLMGPNNNLLETAVEIKSSELPKAAANSLTGKKITKATKVTSVRGVITYKATADAEYVFDAEGKTVAK